MSLLGKTVSSKVFEVANFDEALRTLSIRLSTFHILDGFFGD